MKAGGDVLAVHEGLCRLPPDAAASDQSQQRTGGAMLCHAWNVDRTLVAISPSSREVLIYAVPSLSEDAVGKLKLVATLREHDQAVSFLDWCPKRDLLLSCSHDRNCYVWSRSGPAGDGAAAGGGAGAWSPSLVVLRLNRAVTCGSWAPSEKKFAVGSGAKSVSVCYYEPENNWYVSKLIKKKHSSTVTGVSWHGSGALLATSSTDGKIRVFTAIVRGVDDSSMGKMPLFSCLGSKDHFGECLYEFGVGGAWVHGVTWSPSGNALAAVSHSSMVYHISGIDINQNYGGDGGDAASTAAGLRRALRVEKVSHRGLPHKCVMFLSENCFVAAGYDNVPVVYEAKTAGASGERWEQQRVMTGAKQEQATNKNFGAALARFKNQDDLGVDSTASLSSSQSSHPHTNTLTCMKPLAIAADGDVLGFSSSSDDGKLVLWKTKASCTPADLMGKLKI